MSFRHRATRLRVIRITGRVIISAALAFCAVAAQAQDARYTNSQYGISFQPPAGYTPENLVRYLGQPRADGTWPVLTLIADESLVDLSDKGTDALSKEMRDTLADQGMQAIQVDDRRKREVAGFDAWQMDLTYKRGAASIRQRQVYVPISDHKRTYLFTFIDAAQHFDQSVAAAETAIASFTPAASPTASDEAKQGDGAKRYTLPLIILGAIALTIILAAIYLLTHSRPAAD
ncbi:MAG TPA: hypothetical protein VNI02_21055 [Blastocatellia bacterium]|jgi:hypothetical protein|nr:hypothetical protein [Blastocatellia bacterium]